MLKLMPDWSTKLREDIESLITKYANDNNINFKFVWDSERINDGKNLIINTMVRIQEEAQGNIPPEYHKSLTKLTKNKKVKKK